MSPPTSGLALGASRVTNRAAVEYVITRIRNARVNVLVALQEA